MAKAPAKATPAPVPAPVVTAETVARGYLTRGTLLLESWPAAPVVHEWQIEAIMAALLLIIADEALGNKV